MPRQISFDDGDGHIFEDGEAIARTLSLQRGRRTQQGDRSGP
jgi:hypothetical protein